MANRMGLAAWFSPFRTVPLLATLIVTGCFNPDEGGEVVPEETEGTSGTGDADASSGMGADTGDAEVCAEYCSLIGDHCEGENAQYNGDAICEATCANMPVGNIGDELGNSASCRTFHAVLAAEVPDTHCAHAGPAGDGTCGANCESFCSVAQTLCSGDLSVYAGTEDCIAACETFATDPPYSADVPDGDSFACRLRHLTLASLQPEVHCGHIAPVSPVCFD
ncbi:MAG: hypothetical protein KUG77_16775 [Nannocystaceae bacterium]|nr:hypothetical protein [Nannocystaceae bacterium]